MATPCRTINVAVFAIDLKFVNGLGKGTFELVGEGGQQQYSLRR